MTDEHALIQRAQRGDRRALEALLSDRYGPVLAVCRRMCGPDGDDAAQNALLSIARAIGSFEGTAAFSTWCHRIAMRAALDELRRRSRRPELLEVDDSHVGLTATTSMTDTVDLRLDIDAALASLPDDFRAVLVLRDLCGLDYAEIATTLGIPPGTVRSRIARARRDMVDLLGPLADDVIPPSGEPNQPEETSDG